MQRLGALDRWLRAHFARDEQEWPLLKTIKGAILAAKPPESGVCRVERLRPLYPKGERGRPPIGLQRLLRIHFLQQWYGLADGAMEDALYGSQALRGFAGIDLMVRAVPDETTIMNFRHWLEQHELSQALFVEVAAMLEERGLLLGQRTIVDATIIAAPSSTKNERKARDPEMHQTKKGSRHYHTCSPSPGVTKNSTPMRRGPDCLSGSNATQNVPASTRSPIQGSDKPACAAINFNHNGGRPAQLGRLVRPSKGMKNRRILNRIFFVFGLLRRP
jgi:IS5 family transposase